jgi:hypothetical protein
LQKNCDTAESTFATLYIAESIFARLWYCEKHISQEHFYIVRIKGFCEIKREKNCDTVESIFASIKYACYLLSLMFTHNMQFPYTKINLTYKIMIPNRAEICCARQGSSQGNLGQIYSYERSSYNFITWLTYIEPPSSVVIWGNCSSA